MEFQLLHLCKTLYKYTVKTNVILKKFIKATHDLYTIHLIHV